MRIGFALLAVTLGLGILSGAQAASVIATLDLYPATVNNNRVNLLASLGEMSTIETTDLSGSVAVRLELAFTSQNPIVTGVRFVGGDIDAQDVQFEFGAVATVTGANLAGLVITPTADPAGSPVNSGLFAGDAHQFVINQGTITSTGPSGPGPEIDLTTAPLVFPGAESGSVNLVSQGFSDEFFALMSLPIGGEVELNDVSVRATGLLTAFGTVMIDLPTEGDFNADGVVNAADYTVWRNRLSAFPPGDYAVWRTNYGDGSASIRGGAAGQVVPEPTAGLLALISAVLASKFRHSRDRIASRC